MDGGLFKQFDKWRNQVIKVMANIEAYIDFAESEDIEDTVPNEVKTQVTDILRLVENPNKFLNLYTYLWYLFCIKRPEARNGMGNISGYFSFLWSDYFF